MGADDRFVNLIRDVGTGEAFDGEIAVEAHALLNRFAIMAGRAATLRDHWDVLSDDLRAGWLLELERTAVQAGLLMRSMALGLPPSALVELETATA